MVSVLIMMGDYLFLKKLCGNYRDSDAMIFDGSTWVTKITKNHYVRRLSNFVAKYRIAAKKADFLTHPVVTIWFDNHSLRDNFALEMGTGNRTLLWS